MLDDELNKLGQSAGAAGPVVEALIRALAFILRHPKWMVAGIVVLFLIGASQHVHDMLLLPLGLALVVGGLILRRKGM
jgi:hypothetical protein